MLNPLQMPDDAVVVAKIGRSWGVRGGFKVHPIGDDIETLQGLSQWWIKTKNHIKCISIERLQWHSTAWIAFAEGYHTPEAIKALINTEICVSRSDFPALEKNEYYWTDLIGMAVINRQQELFGHVIDLMDSGPQSTLVIAPPNTQNTAATDSAKKIEVLIPFVDHYVDEVDHKTNTIRVDWDSSYNE